MWSPSTWVFQAVGRETAASPEADDATAAEYAPSGIPDVHAPFGTPESFTLPSVLLLTVHGHAVLAMCSDRSAAPDVGPSLVPAILH